MNIQGMLAKAGVSDGRPMPGPRGAGLGRGWREDEFRLRRLAEEGVASLQVRPLSDGTARVRVAGGPEFALPEALAALLIALAQDGNVTAGYLVDWKPIPQLADLLAKRLQRPVTPHAVEQLIGRLRQTIYDRGGVNPWLIQRRRRHGARFALLRPRDGTPTLLPGQG
jgi:hypothetical protein